MTGRARPRKDQREVEVEVVGEPDVYVVTYARLRLLGCDPADARRRVERGRAEDEAAARGWGEGVARQP